MNRITENLWISDIDAVQKKTTDRFQRVVSVCQDWTPDNVGCTYVQYPLADDRDSERNWGGTTEYSAFSCAVTNVINALKSDRTTLVHCHHGKNQSAAVCIAAYATVNSTDYDFAYNIVEDARPIINPNELMKNHARRYIHEND